MRFRLDAEDQAYIDRLGLEKIESHALDFIQKRLAPAIPINDGKQTPFKGHPVFKAQHATATCCRGCLEKWHGVRKGGPISYEQANEIVRLIMGWMRRELKQL